ncbi:MAG: hypothetical protein ACI9KE_003536 [Polyangiales bacterium]
MSSGGTKRFAVAHFQRVYDVVPSRDVVSLSELTAGLTTFLLKPKLARQVDRDRAKIDEARRAYEESGALKSRLGRVIQRQMERTGVDDVGSAFARLWKRAGAKAKTDLRLWSPAHYIEDGRRESENVVAMSALVLDFDSVAEPQETSERFRDHFHIVHSTWSFRPGVPKFRLCLPFKRPVMAEDWSAVWNIGSQRAGGTNDPALKSTGSTFALPATASEETPRFAFVHEGPLYDPVRDGLAREGPSPDFSPPLESHFRATDGESRVPSLSVVGESDFDLFAQPKEEWDDDFDLF